MVSRIAAPRVVTLAAVAGLHAGALLWLLSATSAQRVRPELESPSAQVLFLQPLEPQTSAHAMERRTRLLRKRVTVEPETRPQPSTAITPPAGVSIDWAAEASSAAERLIESNEKIRRQLNALASAPSAMFPAPRGPHREFPWQKRVEIEGGALVVPLGDRCVLVLLLIFPMGGCTLDKMPARGDLFDHMHEHD
ncbi:MAG TPA: hypothetical protein VKT54_10000 [Steroidobacteraceae bacterium]|nr:hypothetical protein [Steroidobacteraceae bacterium]